MDRVPSAQFRKVYGRLTEPTEVTVNGHVIGTWIPTEYVAHITYQPGSVRTFINDREVTPEGEVRRKDEPTRPMTQAERDAVLRRINKGGK